MSGHTILLADDDAAIRMVLNQALTRAGYEVRPTGNMSTMWNWVSRGEGELLITDVMMPDGNAFDIMPKIKKLRPDLPMIVMSAQNTFMTAIRANEVGAYEYLPKPFDIAEVLSVVARALADAKKPASADRKADEPGETMPLVGRSTAMQDIYRALARLKSLCTMRRAFAWLCMVKHCSLRRLRPASTAITVLRTGTSRMSSFSGS